MNSIEKRYDKAYSKLLSSPYFNQNRINQAKDLLALHQLIPDTKHIITSKASIKCYCISDLHADTTMNQQWVVDRCCRLSQDVYTIIILPGDVGSEIDRIETVFQHLVKNFDAVCYVPGNHEAWRRGIAAVSRCNLHHYHNHHKDPLNL